MNLQEFVNKSSDFFDFIEESFKNQEFILFGIGNKDQLLKVRELWNCLNGLEKKKAERSFGTSKFINVRIRGIDIIIEVCFEGQAREFFKMNKASKSKKKLFSDSDNFIDLDNISVEKDNTLKIDYDQIKSKILDIILELRKLHFEEKDIDDMLSKAIEQCIKETR